MADTRGFPVPFPDSLDGRPEGEGGEGCRTRLGRSILDALTSFRLAVIVLLAAVIFCAAGTFIPQGKGGEEYRALYGPTAARFIRSLGLYDWAHSPGFAIFLSFFILVIFLCLARRGITYWRQAVGGADPAGRVRAGSFLLLHLGLLITCGAAVFSSWNGYTGTANIFVGQSTDLFHDWRLGREEKLPFAIRVEGAWSAYYPVRVRLEVSDPGGRIYGPLETTVGHPLEIAALGVVVNLLKFDTDGREMIFELVRKGETWRRTVSLVNDGYEALRFGDLGLVVTAYRRDLQMIRSDIGIIEGGSFVARGTVSVNSPMEFRGYRIHQRELGRDRYGNLYSGYQVVREPGLLWVWIGCGVVLAGLLGWVGASRTSPLSGGRRCDHSGQNG